MEDHPTKVNRTRSINIRLTDSEALLLSEKSRSSGLGMSAYLRHCGLGQPVKQALTIEQHHTLTGLGRNLNQAMKAYHTIGRSTTELQGLIHQLKQILNPDSDVH